MHRKTMDGNSAAAWVSYLFTETAAVYPITPSTPMAEGISLMTAAGRKNLFGSVLRFVQMQSEAGAAGALHGALTAGAFSSTYTASQGLLLMIPDIYKMAGELLPAVIHTAARTVSTHALSIFGDHSDVYACRQTGAAMLCSSNPQEVMDLGAAAHLCAIKGRIPFIHFFDGFRTSHEIRKIRVWEEQDLENLLDKKAVSEFRERALSPDAPVLRGSAQNPDIFFQSREAANSYYDRLPDIVEEYFDRINSVLGTDYKLFNYCGDPEAEHVIIAMGSVTDTIEETASYLNKKGGKYGLVRVRLYRPFSAERLAAQLPGTVKQITVLDRTKEPGSVGEPLYLDVCAAVRGTKLGGVPIFSGRYGLASKDVTPGQIKAAFENTEKPRFTIGINDDVTHLSLDVTEEPETTPEDIVSCKIWGLGSDGTVGANKNTMKIIGDSTELNVQGYFSYDSKKSGGLTVSHLRFGKSPVKSAYLVTNADFAACHNHNFIGKYDMVSEVKKGGIFLLNTPWKEDELESKLPPEVKRVLAENEINFYIIDGFAIAEKAGTGHRINTVLQSAFFRLTGIIPMESALALMKEAAEKTYGSKGEEAVQSNVRAIDMGCEALIKVDVPEKWKQSRGSKSVKPENSFVRNIQIPCDCQKGDEIPVSALVPYADGSFPCGTSAYEKRGIAQFVPHWVSENCIQCCQCSFVCPHSVIRPFAFSPEEGEGIKTVSLKPAVEDYSFAIIPSVLDCTGCGLCEKTCPAVPKALEMRPIVEERERQKNFDHAVRLSPKKKILEKFRRNTIKGSQFRKPLLEFNGACAGCGETAYAKLVTQLFGERMFIANATGCSSIWGGSAPSFPYTVNEKGQGPAWANSLFEDNAEFGLGMLEAYETLRGRGLEKVRELCESTENVSLKKAGQELLQSGSTESAEEFLAVLEGENTREILKYKRFLSKKSHWIFGGDGWAYDIGFGGLDHVIASGRNLNILVFDTEIYSNTGGQSSKSTPLGAAAQLAPHSKKTPKKNLALMAMTYGGVYVAQVSMGADLNQCVKAFSEGEAYNGPSLIIAYAPCISHGIKKGMGCSVQEEKNAVESGFWQLFRFDPRLADEGKNPLVLDSKPPQSEKLSEFLKGERRFDSADLTEAEKQAYKRYDLMKKLSEV